VETLGETVQRHLQAAQQRVAKAARRREELRRELDVAAAEEAHGRELVETLLAVARQAHVSGLTVGDEDLVAAHQHMRALAGGELRETIARVALRRNIHGYAVHWRQWLDWLREEGFDAAGKSAEATFQTQLARSPLVRRADRDGVYVLDVERLGELRDEVLELHRRLGELPPPDQLTLIGDARAARRALEQRIARAERGLEEAWRMLTEELGSEWGADRPPEAEDVTRMWRARARHTAEATTQPGPSVRGPS
jgi:hypothetical protein